MRIVGWPTVWKEEEGLLPVEVQDIDIHLNTEELTQLVTYLIAASKNASPSNPQELSIPKKIQKRALRLRFMCQASSNLTLKFAPFGAPLTPRWASGETHE